MGFALQLARIAVLSRLLDISDFGLVTMVTTFTGVTMLIRDMGLANASVQAKELSRQDSSNIFWISSGIGLIISFLTVLLAPIASWFYGKDELFHLMLIAAVTPSLAGLASQPKALATREMKFGSIAVVNLISTCMGFGTALLFWAMGFGPEALIMDTVAVSTTQMLGFWLITRFWPLKYSKRNETSDRIKYGFSFAASGLINYLGRNLDKFIIGYFFGDIALGLYSRAYSLLLLPLRQIQQAFQQVFFSAFSKLQNERETFRANANGLVDLYLFAGSLITVPMAIAPQEVVEVCLGAKWIPCTKIFMCLLPMAWIQFSGPPCILAFTASGSMKQYFYWTVVTNILASASILIGSIWGPTEIAFAYSISGLLIRHPLLAWWASTTGFISFRSYLNSILISALYIIPSFLVGFSIKNWMAGNELILILIVLVLSCTVTTVASAFCLPRSRAMMFQWIETIGLKTKLWPVPNQTVE